MNPITMSTEEVLSYRDRTVLCLTKQLDLLKNIEELGLIRPTTGDKNEDGLLTREELPERRAIVEGEILKLQKSIRIQLELPPPLS